MTVREAAQWLKVHEDTIRRNLKRGILPGRRVGRLWRLVRADVEAWLRDVDADHSPALAPTLAVVHQQTWNGAPRRRRPPLYREAKPGPKRDRDRNAKSGS